MIHDTGEITEIMTAEQLERVDIPGRTTELLRGRLVVREPPGTHHGRVQSNLNLAFIETARLSAIGRRGYAALAPDLAAEIVSPDDRPGELLGKVGEWLDAGTRLVWVLDPERGQARVYRADGGVAIVDASGSLDGEDVLPGFTCPLPEVFEPA